ncbi:MAG: methyltransferase domain-containing protein, partial [Magnetococcales bacterium]|nr:methyltransferase domain-containing protein [Magnetococcales bacterium]
GKRLAEEPGILGSIAQMLVERTREIHFSPAEALDLGCRTGLVARLLKEHWPQMPVVSLMPTAALPLARRATPLCLAGQLPRLPFANESFGLVVANSSLQWSGQLPLAMREVKRVMKKDGVLLCAVPGDENLLELRQAMAETDRHFYGEEQPRVVAGYSIHTFGDALQGAGFSFPVADREQAHLTFPHLTALFATLRRMGAANPFPATPSLNRSYLRHLEEVYRHHFQQEGRLPLTVDILFGHGWKNPRPL